MTAQNTERREQSRRSNDDEYALILAAIREKRSEIERLERLIETEETALSALCHRKIELESTPVDMSQLLRTLGHSR